MTSSFGSLDFKLQMIRAAQMKAEIALQRKAVKSQKKALPSQAVTFKHDKLGEMTGNWQMTRSVKVLPSTNEVFKVAIK